MSSETTKKSRKSRKPRGAKVVPLFGSYNWPHAIPGPDAAVIRVLEQTLERAKKGEIMAVAIAGVGTNGNTITVRAIGGNVWLATLIGSVRILDESLIRHAMGGEETSWLEPDPNAS